MMRRARSLLRDVIDAVVWGSIVALLSRLPLPTRSEVERKRTWKRRLFEAGILLGGLAVLGFLVMASGIIPVKASSGHWPVTRWILEFSMARSVSTHSIGVKPPPLDDHAMIRRGAAQYETTCRPCHGAPDLLGPRVARAMTPAPPYLPPEVEKWSSAELFTIVKHGVKLTGMPAWPALHRDDEVWSMVAFLRTLPRLDPAEYESLAFGTSDAQRAAAPIEDLTGEENTPRAVLDRCGRCHGADGRGRGGTAPKLAGQHEAYLYLALRAFQRGGRHSGIMEPVARGLKEQEIRELAAYYARLTPAVGTHGGDSGSPASLSAHSPALLRGREIAMHGIASQKIPACSKCHGPAQPHPRHEYPMLAGQYPDYLVLQLKLFEKGHRGGSPYAHLMEKVAPKLEPQQMRDVAAYYGSLGAETESKQ